MPEPADQDPHYRADAREHRAFPRRRGRGQPDRILRTVPQAAATALLLCGQDFEKYGFGSDTFFNWHIRKKAAPYRDAEESLGLARQATATAAVVDLGQRSELAGAFQMV